MNQNQLAVLNRLIGVLLDGIELKALAGRQLNRRVEIFVVPVVDGRAAQAYELSAFD